MKAKPPVVKRIWEADICRDGGSYCFCFDSDDGHWYEFFLRTRAFEPNATGSHDPPAIYLESSNDGQLILNLSWTEGKAFLAELTYDNKRFQELLAVVANQGMGTN